MCGRFTQRYTWREIADLYGLTGAARNLQAHYNIAPTDTVNVVKLANGATELVPIRWGSSPGGGKSRPSNCRQPSTPVPRASQTSRNPATHSSAIAASSQRAAITS